MLVVIGYNPKRNEFITNEPGTRRGSGYKYNEDVLYNSIRDYKSGYLVPITSERKVMIIVKKNQNYQLFSTQYDKNAQISHFTPVYKETLQYLAGKYT